MAKKKSPKKKINAKKASPLAAAQASGAATVSSSTFAVGDRVKVSLARSWANGYAGAVCQPDATYPGMVMVLLEAKAHQGAKPFNASDLVAA